MTALSRELGINVKTVAKWRKRDGIEDARMGPKQIHSTVLSLEEEAIIVAFRRHTLLALDDCLYALQPTIPHLTRSSLHRYLQRYGISRLPGSGPPRLRRYCTLRPQPGHSIDQLLLINDHRHGERIVNRFGREELPECPCAQRRFVAGWLVTGLGRY